MATCLEVSTAELRCDLLSDFVTLASNGNIAAFVERVDAVVICFQIL